MPRRESAWEKQVRIYLEGQKERGNIQGFGLEFRFRGLSSKRRYDFAIKTKGGNWIIIELDGMHHFEERKEWKCKDDLQKRMTIDLLKTEMSMLKITPLVRIAPSHREYSKKIIQETARKLDNGSLPLLTCYGEEYYNHLISKPSLGLEPVIKVKGSRVMRHRK